MGAAACGLAKGGLLVEGDDQDAGDAQSPVPDVAAPDVAAPDEGLDETSPAPDATDETATADANDEREASIADVRRDRMVGADGRAEAEAGAADADAGNTAGGQDADADAGSDAPPDVGAGDVVVTNPDASGPPLQYDGGTLTDPVFTDSDWVQFCAALSGCGQLPSLTGCDALRKQPYSPDAVFPSPVMVASVVNAAPDCVVVADALGDGLPCSAADNCTGNLFVTCQWGFRMSIDCGGMGMVCSDGTNAGCGFGPCDPSQEGLTYCAGSRYVAKCVSGRYVPSIDCQTFGAECAGAAGSAACEGQGIPCTGASACSGTTIAACMSGFLGTVDCAQDYGPAFDCLDVDSSANAQPVCARGTTCDPLTWQDTCSGQSVSFCNAGVPALYNCPSNAWTSCLAGKCVE